MAAKVTETVERQGNTTIYSGKITLDEKPKWLGYIPLLALLALVVGCLYFLPNVETVDSRAKTGLEHVLTLSKEDMSSLSKEELLDYRADLSQASPSNTGYPLSVIDRERATIDELIAVKTAR